MNQVQAVFVSGPPASGKTTFARALARKLRIAFIDQDTLSEPFLRPYLIEQPWFKDSEEYRDSMRNREYESLMTLVGENLEIGVSCMAVAPFSEERDSAGFPKNYLKSISLETEKYQTIGIMMRIDPEQQIINLRKRGAVRDIEKIERWDKYNQAVAERAAESVNSWGVDVRLTVEFEDFKKNFSDEVDRIATILRQI